MAVCIATMRALEKQIKVSISSEEYCFGVDFEPIANYLLALFVVIPIHGDIECLREGFRLLLCCGKAEIILPPGGGERQAYRISRLPLNRRRFPVFQISKRTKFTIMTGSVFSADSAVVKKWLNGFRHVRFQLSVFHCPLAQIPVRRDPVPW